MAGKNLWDAEWDVSEAVAEKLIRSQFPELSGQQVERIDFGWDNTVFRVGSEFVFRFPRRKAAVPLIHTEAKVLPKLESRLPIPYSKPIYFGKSDSTYPAPFLGYRYLPGAFPISLSDEQRALSTKSLALFLKRLHSYPISAAETDGVPLDHRNLTDLASRKKRMLNFLSELSPHLPKDDYAAISDYLKRLNIDEVLPRRAFLHGDLHFKNLLVDSGGNISGVIDWGDLNIGHPGGDLNVVYGFLPPRERTRFFDEYGEVDEETKVLARMIAVFLPMLIMMQALDDNDERVAGEARAVIRRALADEYENK